MSSRSLRNIDNATLNREAYSNNQTQLKIGNLGEFNNLQNEVNNLYASLDLSGGGEGPIQDVINSINSISASINTFEDNQQTIFTGITNIQQDISSIYILSAQLDVINTDNIILNSANAVVSGNKIFENRVSFPKLSEGFIRNNQNGELSSAGLLTNIDFSPTANISQTKLATITTPGKITNTALSSTASAEPNRIAQRDAAADVYVNTQPFGTTNYKVATNGFVIREVNHLIDNAGETLDTLSELANALGNDPVFFQNVNAVLDTKANIIDASFSGNCIIDGSVVVSSLNTAGVIRTDSSGQLYSSQMNITDFSNVVFKNENIDTIVASGKVESSATSASYLPIPNTIVLRDSSGNVYGNNVADTLYNTTRDKDISWNTWGYYALSKTRQSVAPYAMRYWLTNKDNMNRTPPTAFPNGVYAWSPELKILVVVMANIPALSSKIAYTHNFYDWTYIPFNDSNIYYSVCWSRELGLFVAIGTRAMYSYDGIIWTPINLPILTHTWNSVIWSAELGIFVAVANRGLTNGTNYAMRSFDGINWEIGTTPVAASSTNAWTDVAWSPEQSIFVAISSQTSTTYIMWSHDGLIWQNASNLLSGAAFGVCWSPDLGIFYASASGAFSLLSFDGKIWTRYAATGIALQNFLPIWSREYKMFISTGNARLVFSWNGINWLEIGLDNGPAGYLKTGYIPEYSLSIISMRGVGRPSHFNASVPSTFNLFDGHYAYTNEQGSQYFHRLYFATNLTYTNPINTYGVVGTLNSATNIETIGNTRIQYNVPPNIQGTIFTDKGRIFTCTNGSTGATGWTIPIGTRVNGTTSAVWADSNQSNAGRIFGTIQFGFGRWIVYYKISLIPDTGSGTATQLIIGLQTNQNAFDSFIAGGGSRYRDDFQRPFTQGLNTSYLPRTCIITNTSNSPVNYFLNGRLNFTGTFTNLRVSTESYLFAIKIQ